MKKLLTDLTSIILCLAVVIPVLYMFRQWKEAPAAPSVPVRLTPVTCPISYTAARNEICVHRVGSDEGTYTVLVSQK